MTYEEVKDWVLECVIENCNDCDGKHNIGCDKKCESLVAFDIMSEALEKRKPKRPVHDHHCPNCEYGIPIPEIAIDEFKPFAFYPTYCWECRQRIDWEKTK